MRKKQVTKFRIKSTRVRYPCMIRMMRHRPQFEFTCTAVYMYDLRFPNLYLFCHPSHDPPAHNCKQNCIKSSLLDDI